MALWDGVVRLVEDEREDGREGVKMWGLVVLRMRWLVCFGERRAIVQKVDDALDGRLGSCMSKLRTMVCSFGLQDWMGCVQVDDEEKRTAALSTPDLCVEATFCTRWNIPPLLGRGMRMPQPLLWDL